MNQDLYLLKKIQRKEQSKKRLLIDTSIVSNNAFYNKLTKNDWFNNSKIVASFLSIKSEISTDALNQYLLSLGKILCLPIIENNKEILIFKRYCIGDELKKGKFGVREPVNSQTYLPDIIFNYSENIRLKRESPVLLILKFGILGLLILKPLSKKSFKAFLSIFTLFVILY